MSKVITLDDVNSSKIYVNPQNNVFNFKHPSEYLEPFFDVVREYQESLIIEADSIVENQNNDDSSNISYGRLAVKCRLKPEYDFFVNQELFQSEMGLVYAFDTRKPEIKLFNGKRVFVCTNQCIFGADNVTSILLTSNRKSNVQDIVSGYFDRLLSENQKYQETVGNMMDSRIIDFDKHVGKLVNHGLKLKTIGINPILEAVRLMSTESSKYFMLGDNNPDIQNEWTSYNAVTEVLKKSNIFDECTKTLLLEKIYLN